MNDQSFLKTWLAFDAMAMASLRRILLGVNSYIPSFLRIFP
jgi:hypothetical protein